MAYKKPGFLGKKPNRGSCTGSASGAAKGAKGYVRDDAPRLTAPRKEQAQVLRANQRLGEFVVDRFAHDGRGLASLNGKTLFIEGAIAGETVTARLLEDHPRFIEAWVDEVLAPSPDRATPPCEHYSLCGGCQLQHLAPAAQLQMKQQTLLQQVERWGGLRPREVLPPLASEAAGYRSRARLGVWYEADGGVTLGFRQRQSNKLTPIASCQVLQPALNRLLPPLQHWLEQRCGNKAVTHIELVAGSEQPQLIFRHTKPLVPAQLQSLAELAEREACDCWLEPNGGGLTNLQAEPADPRLTLQVAGLPLQFHPQDFTQVNPAVNEKMVQQVLALLALKPGEQVLDFFCGMGNFTLPLARAAPVLSVWKW